jgi:hypothetical protein
LVQAVQAVLLALQAQIAAREMLAVHHLSQSIGMNMSQTAERGV